MEVEILETNSHNIKVVCAEDCGNSPKKQLLKELTIAFANNDIDFCMECISDNIVWDMIGDKKIQGISEFEEALRVMDNSDIQELQIHNIITHGNVGSVNGTLILNNQQQIYFCDVYNFSGFGKKAKIKLITSYVIRY